MKFLKEALMAYNHLGHQVFQGIAFLLFSALLSLAVVTPLWYLSQNHSGTFTILAGIGLILLVFSLIWGLLKKRIYEAGGYRPWITRVFLPRLFRILLFLTTLVALGGFIFALNRGLSLYLLIPTGIAGVVLVGKILYGFQSQS